MSPVFIWAHAEPHGCEIKNIEEASHGWEFAGTPIHFAAYFGHYEIVHIPLEHNPNIDNKNSIGLCDCMECADADGPTAVTAAHIARAQGYHRIRELLENWRMMSWMQRSLYLLTGSCLWCSNNESCMNRRI